MTAFGTFMLGEGPTTLYGPEDYVNDVKRRKWSLSKHLSGDAVSHVAGGQYLQDVVYLAGNSQAQDYNPNAPEFEYPNFQPGTQIRADWRFMANFMRWDNPEILLNVGKSFSKSHNIAKFKDVYRAKHMELAQSNADHMENQMWALPSTTDMESAAGLKPYSIPTFINEFSDVDNPTDGQITGHYPGWTNVMGVDPGTMTNWQNAKETYARAGSINTGSGQHLFVAFEKMLMKLEFDQLPMDPQYSGPREMPAYIGCSMNGKAQVQESHVANNDFFRWKGSDAHQPGITFGGIEICYISALDTAALYSNPSTSTTYYAEHDDALNGTGSTGKGVGFEGSRYYFVNSSKMPKIFHNERYMVKEEARNPSGRQPFSWVMPVDTWHQLFCRSRKSQGIVTPSTLIATTAP